MHINDNIKKFLTKSILKYSKIEHSSSSDTWNCKWVTTPWLNALHTDMLPLLTHYLYTYQPHNPSLTLILTLNDTIAPKLAPVLTHT